MVWRERERERERECDGVVDGVSPGFLSKKVCSYREADIGSLITCTRARQYNISVIKVNVPIIGHLKSLKLMVQEFEV